jgi:AcrR family transcriptional regulator
MGRLPAARRREQLLDEAAKLFAQLGYARATTSQLAKAAGVTEPIIYRHFNSKRDLFIALIERTASQTLEHWSKRLADAKDPTERLHRLIGDNPMVNEDSRDSYRVFLQALSEIDDVAIHTAVVAHVQNLHRFLTRELEAGQADRKVTHVFSAELIAWLLLHIGLGYGVMSMIAVPGQGVDDKGQHVRHILDRLLARKHPTQLRGESGKGAAGADTPREGPSMTDSNADL